ncbi:enoyl-CoA hydratase/isomerase family protein [Palleronia abyssalis]|uniref:3-hydroxyisobutyryl-CoA hydrolase n=1 Tax=Palleronia abyssalis TaxID=1501240 RepID=A0A2R8BVA6_9RHOB|nr:enoyl-CoA hydratase/isomerase family protein [Palleronia abyssalis]SPJ24053.1 Short-chain-enoyl-CoA hydratase [Palleronia abyssalis]
MSDLNIRIEGCAGRITLTRPKALNALTHEMGLEIERALDAWEGDAAVALVLIDAEGEKAFCAGGDIAAIHRNGSSGNYEATRAFWRDEYRMNARIRTYPKPVVALMQGFAMGGGVGLGCHAAHRVVGESTRIAMPECGIGLIPDAGGSFLLSRAPGRLGEYLGTTGDRMGPACAIHAGFANRFVPEELWSDLTARLCETGDPGIIADMAQDPGDSPLAARQDQIDADFAVPRMADVQADPDTMKALSRLSPLSSELSLRLIREVRSLTQIEDALELEYRCTHRLIEHGDLVEGIRAQVIDKDRTPHWQHASFADVPEALIDAYLAPIGTGELP